MKKIIDGALYNTETARRIGRWSNSYNSNDFQWCEEELYKTKSGKSFLYGEGGPMSKYAVSSGNNSWSGGSHIEPMSPEAARAWAEEHLDADDYAAEFGEPDEASDGRVTINLTIPTSVKAKLEALRSETGKSMSAIISELVEKI